MYAPQPLPYFIQKRKVFTIHFLNVENVRSLFRTILALSDLQVGAPLSVTYIGD